MADKPTKEQVIELAAALPATAESPLFGWPDGTPVTKFGAVGADGDPVVAVIDPRENVLHVGRPGKFHIKIAGGYLAKGALEHASHPWRPTHKINFDVGQEWEVATFKGPERWRIVAIKPGDDGEQDVHFRRYSAAPAKGDAPPVARLLDAVFAHHRYWCEKAFQMGFLRLAGEAERTLEFPAPRDLSKAEAN